MAYVMIVDDDEEFSRAAGIALRREGHEVSVVPDARSAMAAMESRTPDLVILDVMFPEDDFGGFEMARAMHDSPRLDRVPILMLSGVNGRFSLDFGPMDIDSTWLPVADFVSKPVNLDVLTAKAKSLLESATLVGSYADAGRGRAAADVR